MAPGPAAGLALRYARTGRAAFALARRISGDDATASDVVERAFADSAGVPEGAIGDGLVLRRVRVLACDCRRRSPAGPVAVGSPPPALAGLSGEHWRVLDLVALRGAGIGEASVRLGMSEGAVLAHLRDAVLRTRELLSGTRETDDHAESAQLALLG
jgi:DNA-directed RNA polymerase specialized sigma24 family protein